MMNTLNKLSGRDISIYNFKQIIFNFTNLACEYIDQYGLAFVQAKDRGICQFVMAGPVYDGDTILFYCPEATGYVYIEPSRYLTVLQH